MAITKRTSAVKVLLYAVNELLSAHGRLLHHNLGAPGQCAVAADFIFHRGMHRFGADENGLHALRANLLLQLWGAHRAVHLLEQLGDDGSRCACRGRNGIPAVKGGVRQFQFLHRGYIGEGAGAFIAGNCECAQLACAHVLRSAGHGVDGHLDLAAHQTHHGLGAAAVGHILQAHSRGLLQQ